MVARTKASKTGDQAGVVDPAKVARVALENAASKAEEVHVRDRCIHQQRAIPVAAVVPTAPHTSNQSG